MHNNIEITTPENVKISYTVAGLGSRGAAVVIDTLIMSIAQIVVLFLMGLFVAGTINFFGKWLSGNWDGFPGYMFAAFIIFNFLLFWGYFVVWEWRKGATPGKMLLGLRVVLDNGKPVSFLPALLRNLFRIVDFLPGGYLLGMIVMFFHPADKRIGDMVSGTMVVEESLRGKTGKARQKKLESIRARAMKSNISFSEESLAVLTLKDWHILSAFVDRYSTLTSEKKRELAEKVGRHFLQKTGTAYQSEQIAEIKSEEVENYLFALYNRLRDDWEV